MPKVLNPSSRRGLRAQQQQQQQLHLKGGCHDARHRHSSSSSCAAPHQPLWTNHSSILMNAPRKVSFEDGHQSSSSFTSSISSSSSSTQVTASCSTSSSSIASSVMTASSSKSSLRRKAPSVCLVGLAASSSSSSSSVQQQHCSSSAATTTTTTKDECLSPLPCSTEQQQQQQKDANAANAGSAAPSSPWGHFVDILVPLEEQEETPAAAGCHGNKRRLGDSPIFGFCGIGIDVDDEEDRCGSSTSTTGRWSPFQPCAKKPKQHRRCWTASAPSSPSHPYYYGLQPRGNHQHQQHHHHRRRRMRSAPPSSPTTRPSFLPGFFLEGPSPTPFDRITVPASGPGTAPTTVPTTSLKPSTSTMDVERALRRLQV